MGKKVTLQQIADVLGITKVSVSKVLNNQPGISDALRKEVLKTAKEMGYSKSSRLAVEKPLSFAWVCPKRFFLKDESFYTVIYYYINRLCSDMGHSVTCFVIDGIEEKADALPKGLISSNFDGIFIAGEMDPCFLGRLSALNGAKVAIDFYNRAIACDCILVDNLYAGMEVTNHLIDKGHKLIGFLGNYFDNSSICDRYFGYMKALKLRSLPLRDEWHLYNTNYTRGEYSLNFDLPKELPTAFVCHCDIAAFALTQRLNATGVKVPEDVSIISFDNTSICELIHPNLTSVNIDRKRIATQSIERMLQRIRYPMAPYQRIYLGSDLVVRDSVRTLQNA